MNHNEAVGFLGGSVFENNRNQVVRLPADARFPEGVNKVNARRMTGKTQLRTRYEFF